MSAGGNWGARTAQAEHLGPEDTGDNISAKRVAPYAFDIASGEWKRINTKTLGSQLTTDDAGLTEMATTAIPGGVANGGNGNAGRKSLTPFLNSGGSGGGTDNDGQGGHGGTGGYGCGGGGGGAGATGGNGGDGGDGLVIISSW